MSQPYSRRAAFKLLTGGSLLCLGACDALFPASPPRLFVLPRPPQDPSPGASLRWKLAVALPDTPQSLDTSRIALRKGDFELDYFADAAWPDKVSGLIQDLLIDAVEGTGRVSVVQKDTLGLRSDFLLLTQLKDFEARYRGKEEGAPEIQVRLVVQLARSQERDILDSLDVIETRTASANNMGAIVATFNSSADAAALRIARWAIDTGQRSFGSSS